jgi:PGF-CTERM protein
VAGIVVVSVAVAMIGFTGSAGAQTHQIDSCTTITQSGSYELTTDIENATESDCIEIDSSNVTLDGNTHRIIATSGQSADAISASGVSNVEVSNVTILYWGTGVRFLGVTDSEITNVVTDRNRSDRFDPGYSVKFNGISLLSGSNDNVVRNSALYSPGRSGNTGGSGNGILVDGSNDNLIMDNGVYGPAYTGVRVWNAERTNLSSNEVEGDRFRGGSRYGIQVGLPGDGSSNDTVILENDVFGRSFFSTYDPGLVDGIAVNEGDNTTVEGNLVTETAADGIVAGASGTTVVDNTVKRSGEDGIAVFEPATVTDNSIRSSGQQEQSDGLAVRARASDTRVTENSIASTTGDGLHVDGVSNLTIRNNSFNFNSAWSVRLTSIPGDETVASSTLGDTGPVTATGTDFKLSPGSLSGVTLPSRQQDIGLAVAAESTSAAGQVRLEMSYDDSMVSGINESTLSVWRYDGGWSEVAGTNEVNTATNVVVAETSSFSRFAPLASNKPPSASLTAGATPAAPGERLTFNASGSVDPDGTIAEYRWDFDGDGSTDRITFTPTLSHDFSTTGSYAATVTVVDEGDDTDSASVSITIRNQPIVSLVTSPSPTSINANTTFDASASTYGNGTIVEYRWDFDGDGTVDGTTSGAVTNHTYPAAGTYAPTVTVVGDDGRTGTGSGAVTARENLPPGGFGVSYGCNRGFCVNWVGDVVGLTAQTSSSPYTPSDPDGIIVEYRWDFDGDGTTDSVTSTNSASHAFAAPGTYAVNVTAVDDDGAKTSASRDIPIDPREYGTITGTLTNATSGAPVPNATVDLYQDPGQFQTLSNYTRTDENGTYEIGVLAVDHNVTVDPVGYVADSTVVTVADNATTTADFGLTPDPNDTERGNGTLRGFTYNGTDTNLDGVTVEVRAGSGVVAEATSDVSGGFTLSVPADSYDVVFTKDGYSTEREIVSLSEGETRYLYPGLDADTGVSSPFEVSISSTNSPVPEGEALNISAEITNSGDASATRTIGLSVGGLQRDSRTLTLAGGESRVIGLAWQNAIGDPVGYTATVSSANDSDSTPVSVIALAPANFSVAIDSTNAPVREGETLTVTATITNVGDVQGTRSIDLSVAGTQRESRSLTLNGSASRTIDLSWTTAAGDDGNYTATVESDSDSDTASVSVIAPAPANFSVAIGSTNSPIREGETLSVTATITNVGDVQGTRSIDLSADGSVVDSTSLTLSSGASQTIDLSWTPTSGDAGSYTVTLASANDSASTGVKINAASEPSGTTTTGPGVTTTTGPGGTTSASSGQPGFGPAVAVLALVAAVIVATRRRP